MDLIVAVCLLAAGFVLLYYGGEYLVVGSVRLAAHLGVDPVVIGLTIVALGTSLPELLVSLLSAIQGHATVAVGNILGSDIFNICLIVGVSAALANPLEGSPAVARRDVPVLIGGMALFGFLGHDLIFSFQDGIILSVLFAVYMTWTILKPAMAEPPPELVEALEDFEVSGVWDADEVTETQAKPKEHKVSENYWGKIAVGLLFLPLGAHLLVKGGVDLARMANISERFIAMTLVSWGTSLPEMATSLMAAYHGHAGLCISNVVGSNLFNTVAIMGITALVTPVKVLAISFKFDYTHACAVTVLLAILHWRGRNIRRWEGGLLLAAFALMFVLLAQ